MEFDDEYDIPAETNEFEEEVTDDDIISDEEQEAVTKYTVIVGPFSTTRGYETTKERLSTLNVYFVEDNGYFKAGPFDTVDEANITLNKVIKIALVGKVIETTM